MGLSSVLRLTDVHLLFTVFITAAAWKWGDWKNWRSYYPTMLFMIGCNLLYSYISCSYPLWRYEPVFLKRTLVDLTIIYILFPATLLLFLPRMSGGMSKKAAVLAFWIVLYSLYEILAYRLSQFSYHHGWSIVWSILFDCIMFPTLWIHHKKPYWALPIAFATAVGIILYFKIPIS